MNPLAIVELSGVTKSYGHAPALRGVDLGSGRGVTGLLGPYGAGKTTLLRIVATSTEPDGGAVRMIGRDPLGSHAELTEIRRHLGYLPQEMGVPRDMTAFGFVEYVAVLKEWNDRRARPREVRRVLEPVGLGDLTTKRVVKLSSGQRRRVALAQPLVGAPGSSRSTNRRQAWTRPSVPSCGAHCWSWSWPVLPAFFIGPAALLATARQTHSTDVTAEAMSAVPGTEARRTLALAVASLVPFAAGVPSLVAMLVGRPPGVLGAAGRLHRPRGRRSGGPRARPVGRSSPARSRCWSWRR